MFVRMCATRFVTARGRTDVGEGVRIGIARRMCLSGMGVFFLADSKLELKQVPNLLHLYAYEHASTASLIRECRMASEAIVNGRNYVKDIFAEYFIRNPLQIGDPGHTVEIDESAFVRRRANVGRILVIIVGVWRN